jgi:hypothetical protein
MKKSLKKIGAPRFAGKWVFHFRKWIFNNFKHVLMGFCPFFEDLEPKKRPNLGEKLGSDPQLRCYINKPIFP